MPENLHTPLFGMTDEEVLLFARQQAKGAVQTMRIKDCNIERGMTHDEEMLYTRAVCSAISYFTKRDPRHEDAVRYNKKEKEREVLWRLMQERERLRKARAPRVIIL